MKKITWVVILICAVLVMVWKDHGSASADATPVRLTVNEPSSTTPTERAASSDTGSFGRPPALDGARFVETSFRATNATPAGYLIHNWSPVSQQFVSIQGLAELADKFQQELHIQKAKTVSHTEHGENFYELSGEWPMQATVSVTLTSFQLTKSAMSKPVGSTILVIRIQSLSKDLSTFAAEYKDVDAAVRGQHLSPQISACIQGFTSARMSDGQKQQLIFEALRAVQAGSIEGLQSNLVTSISGYSALTPGFLMTNGHKMNLQVATHYDAFHHRTNVLVGTPIITETY